MSIEKENAISKNNAMLIKNLLDISNGKRTSVPPLSSQVSKRAVSQKPKSLNEVVRKKELERIAKENFDMVKRLHKG